MKIVQIVNSITAGGAERLVSDLHTEYKVMGHSSSVIAISGKEQLAPSDGIYCLGCTSLYSYQAYSKLVSVFQSLNFKDADIVHVHLFPALLLVPLALRKADWKGKLFASEHSTSNRRRNTLWGKQADRFTYKPYNNVICVSNAVKNALDAWQPVIRTKTVVISNGARLERFKPVKREVFHKPVNILSVGRLTPAKNYHRALKAVSLLSNIEFVWTIAGDGKLMDELSEHIEELNLSAKVKLLGTRNDIPELLKKADIFFIPSTWEGFGIAAVEAMASGLPIVASDVPGLKEVVGTEAGILVNPESIKSMTDGLSVFLTDLSKALQVGIKGPKQASQFSLEKCAKSHIDLFSN